MVINLCREYCGLSEFGGRGITQLRIPTADFTEPSFEHLLLACRVIEATVDGSNLDSTYFGRVRTLVDHTPTASISCPIRTAPTVTTARRARRVFIHCKGGRGRAVTTALCWLLYDNIWLCGRADYTVAKAMETIKSRRSTAVTAVAQYAVVAQFHNYLLDNKPTPFVDVKTRVPKSGAVTRSKSSSNS
jgi:protein-tyrosine phosphatase